MNDHWLSQPPTNMPLCTPLVDSDACCLDSDGDNKGLRVVLFCGVLCAAGCLTLQHFTHQRKRNETNQPTNQPTDRPKQPGGNPRVGPGAERARAGALPRVLQNAERLGRPPRVRSRRLACPHLRRSIGLYSRSTMIVVFRATSHLTGRIVCSSIAFFTPCPLIGALF